MTGNNNVADSGDILHEIIPLTTFEGEMKTHLLTPRARPRAGLVMCMDVYGIRPELVSMARSYASVGFTVYLPNLFYRVGDVSFPTPKTADERPNPEAVRLNIDTSIAMSARDFSAIFAHAMKREDPIRNFVIIGYCMGGRHALNGLAQFPSIVRSAASIHGGRLVTKQPDSPHLLIRKLEGPAYFAFASGDNSCTDQDQAVLREEISRAPVQHLVERFEAQHGWSFPERYCYDPRVAAHVLATTTTLFKRECGGFDD